MQLLKEIKNSLLHFSFPHVCEGCGSDLLEPSQLLCLRCLSFLPATNFHMHPNNPIEKIFWGRMPVTYATSHFYYTRESIIQHLMHQFKYRGNKEIGFYLGNLMGHALSSSNRFSFLDALIPLPLFPSKERQRGFNQATILSEGVSGILNIPVWKDVICRNSFTETQTKKGRIERWQNMEGRFEVTRVEQLKGKHVLLIDDVVTTGASLEACGTELLKVKDLRLSIATLCFSSHN
ncbi:MAG: ComF family protein [Flavisolibacter sp.]